MFDYSVKMTPIIVTSLVDLRIYRARANNQDGGVPLLRLQLTFSSLACEPFTEVTFVIQNDQNAPVSPKKEISAFI